MFNPSFILENNKQFNKITFSYLLIVIEYKRILIFLIYCLKKF